MPKKNIIDYLLEFPNFLSLFIYSFFMSAISPILVDIGQYLKSTPQDVNIVTTFFMAGTVIGIISTTFLNRIFKKISIILTAYGILIPVTVLLSVSTKLLFFYILYGIAGMLLGITWIQANTNMVESRVPNKDSVVNLGHAFFAIGALTSPFISSYILKNTSDWRYIYFVVLVIVVISMILYIFIFRKKSILDQKKEEKITLRAVFSGKKTAFLTVTVFILIFYMISETIMFSWSPTFFRIDKLFDAYEAGLVLSLFWIGMLIGRLLISVISYKLRSDFLLLGLFFISTLSIIFSVTSNSRAMVFLGTAFTGLGFSGIVPLIISTGTSVFKEKKDIVLVILFSLGLAGNSIGPYVSRAASYYDLRLSVLLTSALLFISLLLVAVRMVTVKIFSDELSQGHVKHQVKAK